MVMTETVTASAEIEPIEQASRDEISALQVARLKWTLRHAYDNVAHYRRAFDAAGVHPDDVKSLDDLSRFPTTTKDDLRESYPFGMFAVPRTQVVRVHASSGTTGRPTVVGYTRADIAVWSRLMARSLRAGGGRPNDIVHIAYGYGLFTGGLGAHYGAEALGCTVVPVSGGQTERQVRLIRDFRPDIIMVTPSYMLVIAEEFRRQGLDPRACSLRTGLFGAEPWSEAMRREIEETFDMHAIDLYGLSEVIGPGVSCECVETKDGLHVWEDHFYPEIVDPATGESLPDGQRGELLFTTLTKEAFPLIRYRTRDLSRLSPGTARTMRRMDKVTGRSDDMLIIRGVNLFPSQVEELILADDRLAPQYLLEVDRRDHLDTLDVVVEVKPAHAADYDQLREPAARDLAHHVKSMVGVTVSVRVVPVGTVERSMGKARRVIDKRPRD